MTKALKAAAVQKLLDAGYEVENPRNLISIAAAIRLATGKIKPTKKLVVNYVQDYVDMPDADSEEAQFVPQKATAPNWGKRLEYKPPVHFRDDEFSQLPRPIAMSGPGNHNQYTKYMLENGRTR